ncbi:MAG: hypothetical protein K0S65_177 [Labilithrix sp.]|jgi:hypothetical protein|nr:hypothetical protein [Labilithrix sp.]
MGSDVVIASTARARGREGIEVITTSAFVFTVDDAQITRVRMYQDLADALAAVALSE